MAAVSYFSIGKQVSEVLGLDPKKVRDVTISIFPNEAVMVTTHQYLQDTEADKLLLVLKQYELLEKNDTESNDKQLPKPQAL
jgi:hypothetical protein